MEGIEAINLIMVDNNNARVKDAGLADQVARLGEKIREMSFELRKTEEMLKGRQFH
jgi:RecA/RadA recombinase